MAEKSVCRTEVSFLSGLRSLRYQFPEQLGGDPCVEMDKHFDNTLLCCLFAAELLDYVLV